MWPGFKSVLISILAIQLAGCGPPISDEELGTVVDEVPPIPSAYEPYKLPEILTPEAAEPSAGSPADEDAQPLPADDST